MTLDRKHPSAAFWATMVVVVMLVVYPLSCGPICGLSLRTGIPPWKRVCVFYLPIKWVAEKTAPTKRALIWWLHLWSPPTMPLSSPTTHDSPR